MPKEAFVPDIAQWYQKQNITALIFDHRTLGSSDGEPRNDVRPACSRLCSPSRNL